MNTIDSPNHAARDKQLFFTVQLISAHMDFQRIRKQSLKIKHISYKLRTHLTIPKYRPKLFAFDSLFS